MTRTALLPTLALLLLASASLAACCGGGGSAGASSEPEATKAAEDEPKAEAKPTLTVTASAARDKKLELTEGYYYVSTKTFTYTKDGQSTVSKASNATVVLSNKPLDHSRGLATLLAPLTDADEVRVALIFVGAEGTHDASPVAAGTYSPKAERFMKLESVVVRTFEGGKEVKTFFNVKQLSDVKLKADGKTLSANIDLNDGKNAVKGSFHAVPWK